MIAVPTLTTGDTDEVEVEFATAGGKSKRTEKQHGPKGGAHEAQDILQEDRDEARITGVGCYRTGAGGTTHQPGILPGVAKAGVAPRAVRMYRLSPGSNMSLNGSPASVADLMKRKLYLIHPKHDQSSLIEVDIVRGAVGIANAAIGTVAALAPSDKFEIKLCEEEVDEVDFDYPADFIGITGKHGQGGRMRWLGEQFRRRGKVVIFGGPHATLAPEEVRDYCDVLVHGELEPIADRFFADLHAGSYHREYRGERAALDESPVPRWDLYPSHRALMGSLQTSRGCPFECEFCDVIQYVGRKQRHKSVDQVLRELDALYEAGFRRVFLADDNLTVYRKRAKDLLRGIAEWNERQGERVSFGTQLSIECSDDAEMLELLARAGLHSVFIGIETPNQESLRETKKRQNLDVDMAERAERFARQGIQVIAGSIVGFDHDGPDIFERHLEFAMRTPIAIFNVAALYAAHATPLRERMQREGRLLDVEVALANASTNIRPVLMSLEQLEQGINWLIDQLYAPENFTRRLLRMIELFPADLPGWNASDRRVDAEAALASHSILTGEGTELGPLLGKVLKAIREKPSARGAAMYALLIWAQQRHNRLGRRPPVEVTAPPAVEPNRSSAPRRALAVVG
ncbi:MAG TPA: radical SAM protein [Polyangiaceae bacterium]|nr:radical SAM protein [Polyangiaceae bacterium]